MGQGNARNLLTIGLRGQKASASTQKLKRSSLAKAYEESPEKYQTPPDRRCRFFRNEKEPKRKTGRALIGSTIEVEYQDKWENELSGMF